MEINPSVAPLVDGGFVITWKGGRGIEGQVFSADGVKQGLEFVVGSIGGRASNSTEVTSLPNGGFVVAWDAYGMTREGVLASDVQGQVFT